MSTCNLASCGESAVDVISIKVDDPRFQGIEYYNAPLCQSHLELLQPLNPPLHLGINQQNKDYRGEARE